MRGWDIAMLIIIMEMSIGFMGTLIEDEAHHGGNLYGNMSRSVRYFSPEDNAYITQYQTSNASKAIGDAGAINILTLGMDWILGGWNLLFSIITAFAAISITLNRQFGLDPGLCAFIQGIIYLMYTWMFIQWRSGRGGRAFE